MLSYYALLFLEKHGNMVLRHKSTSAHFLHRKKEKHEKGTLTPSGGDVSADYVRL